MVLTVGFRPMVLTVGFRPSGLYLICGFLCLFHWKYFGLLFIVLYLNFQSMAKILLTDFVAAIAGKVNGTVYQKGRYSYIRRTKPIPSNPQTVRQQERRSIFGALSQAWRNLSESQRDGWRDLAETFGFVPIFGVSKQQTGNTLYVALNSNLFSIGESFIDNAPKPPTVPAILSLSYDTLSNSAMKLDASFASSPGDRVPTGFTLLLYATPSISAGINAPGASRFRVIGSLPESTVTSAEDILPAYQSVFSAPVTGERVFLRAALISSSTGVSGVPFQTDDIVS